LEEYSIIINRLINVRNLSLLSIKLYPVAKDRHRYSYLIYQSAFRATQRR
jgi:hypothetical protein